MKLRIADRVLVAIAGLLILSACAAVIAQAFFQVDVTGFVARVFTSESVKARAAVIVGTILLFCLGGYCFFVLFRHRSRKDKFVLQKNDSGELNISIKALENMVAKCLEQHPEIKITSIFMQNQRDGLLIHLRGSVAGGVSIPLTVEAAQRQIKQYVTACSGVEIKNITVQIDASGPEAENAPFRITPPVRPLLNEEAKVAQEKPAPAAEAPAPVTKAAPAEKAAPAAAPVPVPEEEEDDRPLHQRLFKAQNEPCIIPEPPAEEEASCAVPAEGNEQSADQAAEDGRDSAGETEAAAPVNEEDAKPEEKAPEKEDSAKPAEEAPEEGSAKAEEKASEDQNPVKPEDSAEEAEGKENETASEEENEEEIRIKKAALKSFEEAQSIFDDTVTGKADKEVK